MEYQTIIVSLLGINNQQIISAVDAQMNRAAEDGYRLAYMLPTENRLLIVMVRNPEPKRGRPRNPSSETAELGG